MPPGPNAAFCSAQTGGALAPAFWAGFTANNSQVEAFAFGNPNLAPEVAQTFTAGFVFQPDFMPVGRLSMTVDYYDIEITDVIASFGAQFFINDCYTNNVAASCARVVRDTGTGQIDHVNTSRGNQGTFATNGVDLAIEYSIDLWLTSASPVVCGSTNWPASWTRSRSTATSSSEPPAPVSVARRSTST